MLHFLLPTEITLGDNNRRKLNKILEDRKWMDWYFLIQKSREYRILNI